MATLPGLSSTADESKIRFICYEPPENEGHKEAPQIAYSEILADSGHAYLPPEVDPNLLKSIRMPIEAVPYGSLNELITTISALILRCVALSQTDARLLAHFVLATWLIDRLPVAPYLALVGLTTKNHVNFCLATFATTTCTMTTHSLPSSMPSSRHSSTQHICRRIADNF